MARVPVAAPKLEPIRGRAGPRRRVATLDGDRRHRIRRREDPGNHDRPLL